MKLLAHLACHARSHVICFSLAAYKVATPSVAGKLEKHNENNFSFVVFQQ